MSTATLTRTASLPAVRPDVVAAYCRISRDGDGRGLGVERQVEDCTRLAAVLGLTLDPVNVVVENDMGASVHTGKPRPLYEGLMARVRSGEVTHVLAYSLSRLTRQMIEREELLAVRALGATVSTAQGQRVYPGMSAGEVQMIRMAGVNDTAESDVISERTRRAFDQNAAKGTPHGPIAYGWDRHHERDGLVVDTLNEDQADVLREAARRMLAGESTRGIAIDLNLRDIPAPRGGKWSPTILTKLMLRERNAARRVHRGVVVGPATWAPLYDDDTHDAVVAHLRAPSRLKARAARRHLLSGLLVCGRCGSERVWQVQGAKSADGSAPTAYACFDCKGVRRKQEWVEAFVTDAVCARLARPDALDWLAQDSGALDAARARLATLRGTLAERVDMLDAGELTREEFTRSSARLREGIAEAEAAVEVARPLPTAVRGLIGIGSAEATRLVWDALPLDSQRAAIRALVTITLLPSKGWTRRFDPTSVRLDWLGA